VTTFSSDHIKYHLHYSAEYRPVRLKKLVNDGTILENDTEYLRAVAVGDLAKAMRSGEYGSLDRQRSGVCGYGVCVKY